MNIKQLAFGLLTIGLISCNLKSKENKPVETHTYPNIKIVGAMKNVMWKGELSNSINLDTISDKNGLYGLGPVSYLKGELLINNGNSYVSEVTSDSTMTVKKTFKASAPFFVYSNVTEWTEIELPTNLKTIKDLEKFIDDKTSHFIRPFTFKIIGKVSSATIHIQNLPEGSIVTSPAEAHKGQTNYTIENENVEIVGFFSTEHKGIFTHHDSFLHMHLITKDESKMGHLDALKIGTMKLYLPKK
ncbi:acetolactate decarboxylase [Winogradskyella echinorum]|uniref:Acetolactate decarboxylase n=1 Tax=Winogradskyella echinorum TaxID=538189 RepID=A0ABR6Y3P5_9FLAO|nr:acetolactate decarboxylase [Winogradskyella echinorum]MBC3847320.1 acetolactate decarboxylase [Winogradskyella echinorum]MBC5751668.1 acetolactate decarboxylase [Winogradskyella echinorum]